MKRDVRTYEWGCDRCKASIVVVGEQRPSGWAVVTTGGWGMTNYSKDEDLCPACAAKEPGARR